MVINDVKTCRIDDCDNRRVAHGWCTKHYNRWRRHGDITIVLPNAKKLYFEGMTCEVEGCEKPPHARNMCRMHLLRWYKYGGPGKADVIKTKLPKGEAAFRHLLAGYKRDAKRRGYKWNLSEREFKFLTKKSCHYCGQPPCNKSNGHGGKTNGAYIYSGIDRVNSNLDYEIGNCVSCCAICNKAKSAMGVEDFLRWIAKIFWYQSQEWEVT